MNWPDKKVWDFYYAMATSTVIVILSFVVPRNIILWLIYKHLMDNVQSCLDSPPHSYCQFISIITTTLIIHYSFTLGSKPTFSTNPSHLRFLSPTGLPSWQRDWTMSLSINERQNDRIKMAECDDVLLSLVCDISGRAGPAFRLDL